MQKAFKRPHQLAFLRKWWQLLILVLAFTSTQAQSDSVKYSRLFGHGFGYKRIVTDSVFMVPLYESNHIPYRAGAIKFRKSDSSFYKYTGTQWLKVQEGGVATNGIDTVYTMNDTIQVIETPDETYFTVINSPYTEVINDTTIVIGGDTLIINGKGPSLVGITELIGDGTAGPGSGLVTFTLSNTPVTPGSYINPNITVDSKGRVTGISSGGALGNNANIGAFFRWLLPATQEIKTVASSNTILWDSSSNTNALTAKVDTSVIATQYDLTQIGSTNDNTNAGLGYRILKPASQELKTLFPLWGELIDSTTNTDGLTIGPDSAALSQYYLRRKDSVTDYATPFDISSKVNYSDTSSMLTPYPRGTGVNGRLTFWTATRDLSSDAEGLYNSTTNTIETDSVKLIHSESDSSRLIPYPVVRLASKIVFTGNSITEGSAASPIGDSAYAILLKNYLQLPHVNRAISGAGIRSVTSRYFEWMLPLHDSMTTVMIGFNDIHSSDINSATGFKTRAMLYNGLNTVFANHFLKSWVSASDASVTKHGTWTTGYQDSRNGQKGTNNCAFTSTTNDSLKYTATDSTFVIGFIGGDGSAGASIGTTVQIYVDGVLNKTISTNNQADNILSLSPDNAVGGRERGPMAVIISGLTYASHTIKVVKSAAGGFLIVNYFGHLREARTAPPLVLFHIPWMKAAGYAPGQSSTVKTDLMNSKYDSLRNTWPVAYPVYTVRTNDFYDTATGTSGDNIHPNNTGHRQIFEAAEDVLPSIHKTALREGSMFFTDKFYGVKKNSITAALERRFFIMDDTFYGDTANNIRNRLITQAIQTASLNISGQGRIAEKIHSRGSTFGGNIGFDSTVNYGMASTLIPYEAWKHNAAADNSRWDRFTQSTSMLFRVVNDASSAATEWLRVWRTGITVDSIINRTNIARWYNIPTGGNPTLLSLSVGQGKAGVGVATPIFKFHILDSVTSQTVNGRGVSVELTGSTYNTNAAALLSNGGYFNANSTRGSGSNPLTNRNYFSASGAQNNYALVTWNGDVGIGDTTPIYKLELNGTFGLNKIHIPLQTTNGPRHMLVLDTTTNQVERMDIPAGGGGGVTSVGLATGTSGTDIGVSGSPITSSGNITLNIPTASASNRGALSSTDWSTFNNKLSNITSLISAGSNVSLTGTGTSGDPYVINSSTGDLVIVNDADHTVTSTQSAVRYQNAITASRTVTLPDPGGVTGREIWVKWNTINGGFSLSITTVSGTALIYFDGTSGSTSQASNVSFLSVLLKSDGTSWYKIN